MCLGFENDNILAQAESLFTAGYEATATIIAFTLYELSRYPEHEEKLYDEIKNVKDMNNDSLKKLTFLDQVINEVLRLYPSLPFVDRVAEKNYKV